VAVYQLDDFTMLSFTIPLRSIKPLILPSTGLYLILYLHDRNLYPHLSAGHAAVLSSLRLGLLLAPLVLGYLITRLPQPVWWKVALVGIWLMLLPYTLYSTTEIRHVAELCRLPEARTYYTDSCLADAWTLLPVLVYAVFGGGAFVFSLRQVSHHLFTANRKRIIALAAICLYAGLAATFGLYSRLNAWDILIAPVQTMQFVYSILGADGFFVNAFSYVIFAAGITFLSHYLPLSCLRIQPDSIVSPDL